MSAVVELRHISKSYEQNTVLDDFNLTVPTGAFVTMIGSSGCGKTTVLKMINGLIEPDKGEILLDGVSIRERI